MNIKNRHNNRIQIIVALLLIAAIASGGVIFDSYVWAQPQIGMAEYGASDENETAALYEPMSKPALKSGIADEENSQGEMFKEKLYLRSSAPVFADIETSEPEIEPVPLPEGEESGFVTVGLYSSCSYVPEDAVQEIDISCTDGFILAKTADRGYVPDTDLRDYSSFSVKLEDGVVNLYDESGSMVLTGLCTDDVLISAAGDPDLRIITIGSAQYRDGVMFRAESEGMTVISFVNLEHYLWGTLNQEMTYSNPAEALKAQAVASRTFAVNHYGYHGKYGFDLCPSTNCQVYKGVSGETEQTTAACMETENIVTVVDGKVSGGYFFASSGGYTRNSEDVWGGRISCLRAVPDPYAPLDIWNTSITFEELADKLNSKKIGVGNIISVEITERYPSGAVNTMLITGDAGSVTLGGTASPSDRYVVSVMGSKVLQSVFFSMSGDAYPGVEVKSLSALETTSGQIDSSEAAVLDADGTVTEVNLSEAYAADPDSVKSLEAGEGKTPVYTQQPALNGVIYFSGTGYGHGVGMPQTSAAAMAQAGYSCEDILKYYYTGIELLPLKDLE